MRWTRSYIPTLRETPTEAELVSHRLLLRGGYIRKLAAGVYLYLPLMQRVIEKFANIVREEMNAAGALEITMSVLCPAEIWQESGRYFTVGKEQMRMKDRHNHEMVMCGTQLPLNLYQIQVKFRDEIRPRFGLMRGREFLMKDAYTFDATDESFDKSYQNMVDTYFRIFKRAGLDVVKVESDTGAMGGRAAHEFMMLVDTNGGEEVILFCDKCDYAANVEQAEYKATDIKIDSDLKAMEEVDTPGAATIEEVTAFLKVDATRLVKTLMYMADDKPAAALVRGDRDVNEVKLKNALGAVELEMATSDQVEQHTGAPVGFAGPVGLGKDVTILVDPLVAKLKNAVVGANKFEKHILNVNIDRDFKASKIVGLTLAREGDQCPHCEGHLVAKQGIEVGNTFMLGTKYSESLGAKFLDAEGKEHPIIMGSYGVGVTRTPQAALEKYFDDKGIIWPKNIAPYLVELVPLKVDIAKHMEVAEKIYHDLMEAGIDVLLDDRDERPGVKFNDADLIGLPVRITIGEKSLKEGKVELKARCESENSLVAIDDVVEAVKETLKRLN
jgi:prolyl-tRNA synthetase